MLTSSIYVIGIVVEIIWYTKLILHTTLEFKMPDLITDIICSGQKDWSDVDCWMDPRHESDCSGKAGLVSSLCFW